MHDPWLRAECGAWLPSPQNQGVHNLNVSDLMVHNAKMLDKEKIESLFPLHVANQIIETPLFNMIEKDEIIWIDSPTGCYSVKSGYKFLMNISGSNIAAVRQYEWQQIWSISAPPKAKHLLWRILKSCLPTRSQLQERHVQCSLVCPVCNNGNEDDWHVLFGCEKSVQARQAVGIRHLVEPQIQQFTDIGQIIYAICSNEDQTLVGVFAMLVWVLWNNRNNQLWNNVGDPGQSLGVKARLMWEEWNVVKQWKQQQPYGHNQQQRQDTNRTVQQQQVIIWQAPSFGWVKCNVDASFHREIHKTSTGWCLRDHMGRFVQAGTTWLDGNCSILEGEAMALLKAIETMQQ